MVETRTGMRKESRRGTASTGTSQRAKQRRLNWAGLLTSGSRRSRSNQIEMTSDLGNRIREARKSKRLSMRELASTVGVSHVHIHNIERGRATPSAELLARLCRVLPLEEVDLPPPPQDDPIIVALVRENPDVRRLLRRFQGRPPSEIAFLAAKSASVVQRSLEHEPPGIACGRADTARHEAPPLARVTALGGYLRGFVNRMAWEQQSATDFYHGHPDQLERLANEIIADAGPDAGGVSAAATAWLQRPTARDRADAFLQWLEREQADARSAHERNLRVFGGSPDHIFVGGPLRTLSDYRCSLAVAGTLAEKLQRLVFCAPMAIDADAARQGEFETMMLNRASAGVFRLETDTFGTLTEMNVIRARHKPAVAICGSDRQEFLKSHPQALTGFDETGTMLGLHVVSDAAEAAACLDTILGGEPLFRGRDKRSWVCSSCGSCVVRTAGWAPQPVYSTHALADLQLRAFNMVQERGWQTFHTGQALALAIVREATELADHWLWLPAGSTPNAPRAAAQELGDVLLNCLHLARVLSVDPGNLVSDGIDRVARKYPPERYAAVSKQDVPTVQGGEYASTPPTGRQLPHDRPRRRKDRARPA